MYGMMLDGENYKLCRKEGGILSQFLGVILDIGEDGTIKIPVDKLETAGIKPGGKVEVFSNVNCVYIRQAEDFCDICGGNHGKLQTVGKTKICNNCLQHISSKANEMTNSNAK